MHSFISYLILSLVAFWLPCFLLQAAVATGSLIKPPELLRNETGITGIGVILGQTSRPGKETKVSIEIAIQDFNIKANWSSVLYFQNSLNKPSRTAFAVKELINDNGVKAILGGHTCEEASAIAEVISEVDDDIPLFLSLADMTPPQATDQWPFLVQTVPSKSIQMNAVAAVLQSWGIHQVTLIYETSHLAYPSSSIISHLSQAFQQTGCELTLILPLSSGPRFLNKEVEVLKRQKSRVFIIHTSLELGIRLFQTAKKMEMTGNEYLWIATNEITDLFHSINSNVISSLKGMVGVKSYFPENTPEFLDFRKRFRQKFSSDYPEEEQDEPGIFAVQGYNAVKLLGEDSPEIFHHWKAIPATTVEIVSVNGKGYLSVYWTEGLGFSETIDGIHRATTYTHSMDEVEQALWPVQPLYAHRRHRNLAESSKNLMTVGVPEHSLFNQFVKVEFNHEKKEYEFSGFVIAVFEEMMRKMNQPFKYQRFNGSYDDLIKEIPKETFDAVAGDVTILSERHKSADFTQPFTESGLQMIVPVRYRISNQAWLFLKPFTAEMWWLSAAITIYNGFIIWLIERKHSEDLRGSIITQIGIVFWLAFTTLFTLRGDRLHSNLSRMAVVMWLFVALIITQSYTANLSSMLTAQRLEPVITSVEKLRNMDATVGYCNGLFIGAYLRDVLDFKNISVKSYNSTHQYAEALNSGEIKAIFLDVPSTKVFLAQYCKRFIRTGETFKVGGFGFAFRKGFNLSDANAALMEMTESRKLKELEDTFLISEKCVDEESSLDKDTRLSPRSFWVLFELTGGTSTVALAIYIIINIREFKKSTEEHTSFIKIISAFIKYWQQLTRRSSKVVNVESDRYMRNVDQRTQDDTDGLELVEFPNRIYYQVRI
ncbi:glutamate receptor 2.8-like [Cynara cardunculus var. scolymus]|uniref:glutamate receptor 2.8-like n=1 Tax=Cynara cardunculus var. scolymus TaxID=59895 RepID=UPI000D62A1F6|nr:glutamate receptor 2.8-like [Cynara cardunculus var. scolymus]